MISPSNAEQITRNGSPTDPLAIEQARDVLLRLLRADPSQDSSLPQESFPLGLWEDLLGQAKQHQVEGLLYRRVKQSAADWRVPGEVVESLKRRYLLRVSRSTRTYHMFGKVLRSLKENDVPVIVLKGAFLAEAVYGDTALRLMTDLDLLVRPEDKARVGSVLLGLGFAAEEEENAQHGERNAHDRYFLSESRVFVEVHWNIDESPSPFNIDVDGLWARAQDAVIAGVQVRALSPEDLLLHLCIHASFRHLFGENGLRSMYDIAETISHYDGRLDWTLVRQRSRQWGTDTWLFLSLYLAERVVGARVPQSILKQVEPRRLDPRLLVVCESRLFANGSERVLISDNWGKVQISRNMPEKILALLEIAFPSRGRLAQIYSIPAESWRVFLYYPVRLGHLMWQHGPIAWRFWRADREIRRWLEGEAHRAELEATKRMMLRSSSVTER